MAEGGGLVGAAGGAIGLGHDAEYTVGVNIEPLKRGMKEANAVIQKEALGWGTAFKALAIGFGGLATAFVGFAAEGVKKADELDAAVERIGAQMGYTKTQIADLRAGILDMSTRVEHGIDDLSKAQEKAAKSGYKVADANRIVEASSKAATIANADLGNVTDTVITAMKAWGVEAVNVNSVTDTLVTTVGHSRIGWDVLSRIIATAAPIAKDAGVSFKDLNAAIMAIGRSGLDPRRASAGILTLIRNLSSPAAQAQMAALGVTVTKSSLAHDGLLKTLQRLHAAAGKHIDVIIKNKKGQIDYAKSIEATKKANTGQLQEFQKMVGGASGLLTADILLANHAKDYKQAQDALNHSLHNTTEEFEAVKEADLGVQVAIIRNTITKLAIDLGTRLLPYVAQFVAYLAETVPKAIAGLTDLWNGTLAPALGKLAASFGNLGQTIGETFLGWDKNKSRANGIATFFQAMADVTAGLADTLSHVLDTLSAILRLPGVGMLGQLMLGGLAVKTILSLVGFLRSSLTGTINGLLNVATGGIFRIGAQGPVASGAAQAAGDLATKATIEEETKRTAIVAENEAKRTAVVTEGQAKQVIVQEEGVARQGFFSRLTGGAGVSGLLGNVGGLLGGLVSKVFAPLLVASIVSDLAKAPVAALLEGAGMPRVAAVMKEDFLGGLIAAFQAAGAGTDAFIGHAPEMQIGNAKFKTLELAKIGVTSATFDRLEAPYGTIDHAQAADLITRQTTSDITSPQGENEPFNAYIRRIMGGFSEGVQAQLKAALGNPANYSELNTAQTGRGFYQTDFANGTISPAGEQAIRGLLAKSVRQQVYGLQGATRDEYLIALKSTLTGQGFTPGQQARLTLDQLRTIGDLASDASGDFSGVIKYLTTQYVGAVGKAAKAKPMSSLMKQQIATLTKGGQGPGFITDPSGARVAVGQFMKGFGKNWEKALAQLRPGGDITKVSPATLAKLRALLGPGFREIMASIFEAIDQPFHLRVGDTPEARAALKTLAENAEAATKDYLSTVPQGVQEAVTQFQNQAGTLSPKTQAALNKRFNTMGGGWLTYLVQHPKALDTGSKADKALAKTLSGIFGEDYHAAIAQMGPLLLAKLGGADGATLRAAIAKAVAGVVAHLRPIDFLPDKAGSTITAAQVKKDKAEVTKILSSANGKIWLKDLSSGDAGKAKTAADNLSKALAKVIPDPEARKRIIDSLAALEKAGNSPALATLDDAIGKTMPKVQNLGDVILGFSSQVQTATARILGAARALAGGTPGGYHVDPVTGKKSRSKPSAWGSVSMSNGPGNIGFGGQNILYGEAGNEGIAIFNNPRRANLGQLVAAAMGMGGSMPGGLSRAGALAGGATQQIHVDHMHIQNAQDERAVLEALEFMSPGGLG